MARRYSKEMFEFVKANIKGTRIYEMARLVNERFNVGITERQMNAYCSNHKLTNGLFHKSVGVRICSIFTAEQRKFLQENYVGKSNQELTDLLNKKFQTSFNREQIKRYKNNKKLDSGLKGYYPKGNIPHNKGQKMPASLYEKCKKSMFKPGHIPHNKKPVGSERIDKKDGYTLIKIAEPNVWVLKHKYIYEQANGPVPKGHIVSFLDGNRSNFALENLVCISLKENAYLNHLKLRTNNKEVAAAAIKIARIKTKISTLKRGKESNNA